MPVNVWNRLFDQLKTLSEMDKQEFSQLLQLPVAELLLLQNTPMITELLDPENSLQIHNHRVSTYIAEAT